jgi:hypothetical protein
MLLCLLLISVIEYPSVLRKFSLAVMIVPSMLNSMTACDSLIAAAWAKAFRTAELLRNENI